MSAGTTAFVFCNYHDEHAPAGQRVCVAQVTEGSTRREARKAARKAGWLTGVDYDGKPPRYRTAVLFDFCPAHKTKEAEQ